MGNLYKLPLVFEPAEEGGWTITCPILPGFITEADSLEEINENVQDALEALVEGYHEIGQPLPEVLKPLSITTPFVTETLLELAA